MCRPYVRFVTWERRSMFELHCSSTVNTCHTIMYIVLKNKKNSGYSLLDPALNLLEFPTVTHVVKNQIKMYTSQRGTVWHFSCSDLGDLICRVYPSRVRDIATHCRLALWPKRLRHYLGCTVQRLFCLDQQQEDQDLFLYISLQIKLAILYPMITISENIWIISNMYSKRTSTLRLVSAAFCL